MSRTSPRGGELHITSNEMCIECGVLYTYSVIVENPGNPYYFVFKTEKHPVRITGELKGNSEVKTLLFTDPVISVLGSETDVAANGLSQFDIGFMCYYGATVVTEGEEVLAFAGYGDTPSANAASQSRIGKFEIAKESEILLKLITTAKSVNLVIEAGMINMEE